MAISIIKKIAPIEAIRVKSNKIVSSIAKETVKLMKGFKTFTLFARNLFHMTLTFLTF
jgi:hypothetical protein